MNAGSALKLAVTVLLATTVLAPSLNAQFSFGTVLWHDGAAISDPPGTGSVEVDFDYGDITLGPHRSIYERMQTHEVQFAYAPGPSTVFWARSYLLNYTDTPWTGFQIELQGAGFSGWDWDRNMQAWTADPVVDAGNFVNADVLQLLAPQQIALQHTALSRFSVSGSTIDRFGDSGGGLRDSLLTVTFGDPVLPGKGFALWYNIIPSPGAAGEPGFTAFLMPVPEPAGALLLSSGVITILASGRKRSRNSAGVRVRAPTSPIRARRAS